VTNTHYKMLRPGEQRGILQLKLDVRGREVVIMNTHIDFRRMIPNACTIGDDQPINLEITREHL